MSINGCIARRYTRTHTHIILKTVHKRITQRLIIYVTYTPSVWRLVRVCMCSRCKILVYVRVQRDLCNIIINYRVQCARVFYWQAVRRGRVKLNDYIRSIIVQLFYISCIFVCACNNAEMNTRVCSETGVGRAELLRLHNIMMHNY